MPVCLPNASYDESRKRDLNAAYPLGPRSCKTQSRARRRLFVALPWSLPQSEYHRGRGSARSTAERIKRTPSSVSSYPGTVRRPKGVRGRIARVMLREIRVTLAVGGEQAADDAQAGPLFVAVLAGTGMGSVGNDALDIPFVGAEQESDERLFVVRIAAGIGLDQQTQTGVRCRFSGKRGRRSGCGLSRQTRSGPSAQKGARQKETRVQRHAFTRQSSRMTSEKCVHLAPAAVSRHKTTSCRSIPLRPSAGASSTRARPSYNCRALVI